MLPLSATLASIWQPIAMFKSIACISSWLVEAIKWIPEKIGVLGLEEIAFLAVCTAFARTDVLQVNLIFKTSWFIITA